MPLKLKSKNTKKKSVVKKASKKKENKNDPYLHKNYSDITELKLVEIEQTINKLKYAHVLYYNLDSVEVDNSIIKLDNGWIELIMLMLDTVRVNNENNFINYLMENKVTTQSFCVDTKYGRYNFEVDNYRAFKLYNSEYYVEAIFNVENIFHTIVRLAKCMGIAPEKIKFKMINKEYSIERLELIQLEEESIQVNIKDSLNYFKRGIYLMNIKISNSIQELFEEKDSVNVKIHNIQSMLYIVINYFYDTYKEEGLKKLTNLKGDTYVSVRNDDDNDKPCRKIKNSDYYIYTDCEPKSTLLFIERAMSLLGMDRNDIILYFKRLKTKEEKKEWEVD